MEIKTLIFQSIALIVVLYGFVLTIIKINPRLEMKSYPDEVVNRVKRQTREEKRTFKMLAFPAVIIIFGGLIVWTILAYKQSNVTFLTLFLHFLIVFMVANVVDLLVMDYLIVCTIHPMFMMLPGTQPDMGYKNYFYYFKGFLKGIVISLAGALAMGAVVFLIVR